MDKITQPYISVIIPAYKEGTRILKNLAEIEAYFKEKDYSYEVLVVIDGSPDNTDQVVNTFAGRLSQLRIIDNEKNHGKGYVVRQGLLEAKGQLRLFLDADGSTSISHLETFLPEFERGADVVIGSRDIQGAYVQIHQPKYREIMGDMGNLLIRMVLGLWGFPDTQCGFKMLNEKAAKEVASRMVVDRFGFDFELIVLAKKMGFSIVQVPVRWLNEEGSTVGLTGPNGFIQVLKDLFKTRFRLWTGRYNLTKKINIKFEK